MKKVLGSAVIAIVLMILAVFTLGRGGMFAPSGNPLLYPLEIIYCVILPDSLTCRGE